MKLILVLEIYIEEGLDGGSWYSLVIKKMPIFHLINIFAYSLKSTPLFIKILIFSSLEIKFYMRHCLFPSLSCLSQATRTAL